MMHGTTTSNSPPSVSSLVGWQVPVLWNTVYMENEAGVLILTAVSVTLYCSFLFSVLRPVQINWWRTTWSWGRHRSHCSHRHNNIIQLMKVLFAMKDKRLVFLCWNSYKFSTLQNRRFLLLSFLFLVLLNPIARSVWRGNIFCYIYPTTLFLFWRTYSCIVLKHLCMSLNCGYLLEELFSVPLQKAKRVILSTLFPLKNISP